MFVMSLRYVSRAATRSLLLWIRLQWWARNVVVLLCLAWLRLLALSCACMLQVGGEVYRRIADHWYYRRL